MQETVDMFINFLRKKNLQPTKQREEILRIFLKTDKHLSVEELYNIVKKKDKSIGQVTVFRTLKLLCAADLVKEVKFVDKFARYEIKYGHQHHDHLVCTKCGKFIETMNPEIEKLQDKLCKKFNFSPIWHKMNIFGICKRCKKG